MTKREAWRVEHPVARSGGTLSTAGNLVFQGRGDGIFAAYRATDGKMLWQFDAQVGIAAGADDVRDGRSSTSRSSSPAGLLLRPTRLTHRSGRLLVFALDGKATLAPNLRHDRVADPAADVRRDGDARRDHGGRRAVQFQYCRRCHNPDFNLREERRDPRSPSRRRRRRTRRSSRSCAAARDARSACRRSRRTSPQHRCD